MQLDIVTPQRRMSSVRSTDVVLPCEVSSVIVPGIKGEFEVLPGHSPFITLLKASGRLRFTTAGRTVDLEVAGGFAEIDRDSITVMCEAATLPEEVDRAVEEAEHTRLQQELAALGPVSSEDPNFRRISAEVERATTKLTLVK